MKNVGTTTSSSLKSPLNQKQDEIKQKKKVYLKFLSSISKRMKVYKFLLNAEKKMKVKFQRVYFICKDICLFALNIYVLIKWETSSSKVF